MRLALDRELGHNSTIRHKFTITAANKPDIWTDGPHEDRQAFQVEGFSYRHFECLH